MADKAKTKSGPSALKIVLLLLVIAAASPILVSFVKCPYMGYYKSHMPKMTGMMEYRAAQAELKHKSFKIKYDPVPLNSISTYLRKAAIAAEDDRFYQHNGFDIEAMKKAYELNQKRGRTVRGGSTITQQVAKNVWLSPRRSWWRKSVEAVLAWRMEHTLSKDRILEIYLNIIEWGNGVFGASAASRIYFGEPPSALTPPQAALLAAAIPSPLRSNPAKPSAYLLRRQSIILDRLMGKGKTEELPADEGTTDDSTPGPVQPKEPGQQ